MLYGEIKDIGSFFSFQYQVISLTSEAFNFSVQRPRRGSLCYSLICSNTNKKSTVWASLIPSIFSFSKTGGRAEDSLSPPRLKSFFLFTNHYLFPSIPNVHAVSVKTTGTVLQAHFPDGSHLPASPLLSLAHLCDESQHISLAAICLSAFNANQTSEQPRSLMGGGLETSPASLPDKPCFTPLLIQPLQFSPMSSTNILLCFVSSPKENFWSRRYSSSLFGSFSRWPLPLIFPHSSIPIPPPHLLPFLFLLARCSHIFVCSCEGVSDACVVRGGRGSSRAWREHTLWELPFITPSPNEQHAECNTDAITFRNSFS